MLAFKNVRRFALVALAGTVLILAVGSPAQAITYPMMKNQATGLCLDSNSSGSVYAQACNGGNYQRWIITSVNGAKRIKDWATGRCLYTVSPSASFVGTSAACLPDSWSLWTDTWNGTYHKFDERRATVPAWTATPPARSTFTRVTPGAFKTGCQGHPSDPRGRRDHATEVHDHAEFDPSSMIDGIMTVRSPRRR